eukprot:2973937-Amphidinium_carterae.1
MKEKVELARRQRRYRDLTSEVGHERRHAGSAEDQTTQAPSTANDQSSGDVASAPSKVRDSRSQSKLPQSTLPSRRPSTALAEGLSTPRAVRRRLEPAVAEVGLEGEDTNPEPSPMVDESP